MKQVNECPYCGAEDKVEFIAEGGLDGQTYYCRECDRWFSEEDIEFEELRHKISAIISAVGGDEESPLVCSEPIMVGNDEAQGLSTLEMPYVVSLFHDAEGIVWLNINYSTEPIEFDVLSLNDARAIWNELKEYVF